MSIGRLQRLTRTDVVLLVQRLNPGTHYFDRDTLRFFGARWVGAWRGVGGVYFVENCTKAGAYKIAKAEDWRAESAWQGDGLRWGKSREEVIAEAKRLARGDE